MTKENKREFILLRAGEDQLGTISNISSIVRVFAGYDEENNKKNPWNLTIQYNTSTHEHEQRTKFVFEKEESRNALHQKLVEALDPIILEEANKLDSIM